ncbi:MAG: hypothetical protein ACKOI2_03695, partial [Actinomycetota bacterium]
MTSYPENSTDFLPFESALHRTALQSAWTAYDDGRAIVSVLDTSPRVSTNTVYRIVLDDGTNIYGKVSNYGSYFLFAEDHDRLFRCIQLLRGSEFENFLAPVLSRNGRPFTWYDGSLWVAFYGEARKADSLPPRLSSVQRTCLAQEVARFHRECDVIAPSIPATSNSIKSDAIHLLDLLSSPFAPRNFELPPEDVGVLWKHTHDFLLELERIRYDSWHRIPVLVDWNLGNFSVEFSDSDQERFRLFSRWDYDWFRLESRVLDFYFLSRVASKTGDRSQWTYSSHTLHEPQFLDFLSAYHEVFPLTEEEVRFIPEAFRFFVLNYVVREGSRPLQDLDEWPRWASSGECRGSSGE